MPDCPTALIIIDVINDLEFPGGDKVLPWAEKMADRLLPASEAARRAGVPVIYANDNFGKWHSSWDAVFDHATRPDARGRDVAKRLEPAKDDYFILKPKHSAYYATSLEPLLQSLGIRRVVMAGIATNLCVLFSAHDAHMRDYETLVLSDCCAAETDNDHNIALDQLKRFCGTTVLRSDQIDWAELAKKPVGEKSE